MNLFIMVEKGWVVLPQHKQSACWCWGEHENTVLVWTGQTKSGNTNFIWDEKKSYKKAEEIRHNQVYTTKAEDKKMKQN